MAQNVEQPYAARLQILSRRSLAKRDLSTATHKIKLLIRGCLDLLSSSTVYGLDCYGGQSAAPRCYFEMDGSSILGLAWRISAEGRRSSHRSKSLHIGPARLILSYLGLHSQLLCFRSTTKHSFKLTGPWLRMTVHRRWQTWLVGDSQTSRTIRPGGLIQLIKLHPSGSDTHFVGQVLRANGMCCRGLPRIHVAIRGNPRSV